MKDEVENEEPVPSSSRTDEDFHATAENSAKGKE